MYKIKWAPLLVPWRRRLQTMSVFVFIFIATYGIIAGYILFIALFYTRLKWLNVIYTIYLINDGRASFYGNRKCEWVRNLSIWRYCAEYFPIKLVKTAHLDPSKNYLALSYPHGLVMAGTWLTVGSNALDFNKIFPGLKPYIAIAPTRFNVPYVRDLNLSLGGCSSTEECLLSQLDQTRQTGNFILMNTGGSKEIMCNSTKEYNLVLESRRGFARIALKSGASIVPVFCFGENRLFDSVPYPEGTFLRKLQDKFRQMTQIALLPPSGRGFFHSFGVIPHRIPLTVVVGAPLEVGRVRAPSRAQQDALHARLVSALRALHRRHERHHEPHPATPLNII